MHRWDQVYNLQVRFPALYPGFIFHFMERFCNLNICLQLHPRPSAGGQWEYFGKTKSVTRKGKFVYVIKAEHLCLFKCRIYRLDTRTTSEHFQTKNPVIFHPFWHIYSLLFNQPSTEGYIAVILPKFEESKSVTENLLSRKEFESIVSKRDQQPQASWWRVPSSSWNSSFWGFFSSPSAQNTWSTDWMVHWKIMY